MRDLLALLSLIVEPCGDGLLRVAALPRYDVSLQDVATLPHATCGRLTGPPCRV